jgi:hypothetical protein
VPVDGTGENEDSLLSVQQSYLRSKLVRMSVAGSKQAWRESVGKEAGVRGEKLLSEGSNDMWKSWQVRLSPAIMVQWMTSSFPSPFTAHTAATTHVSSACAKARRITSSSMRRSVFPPSPTHRPCPAHAMNPRTTQASPAEDDLVIIKTMRKMPTAAALHSATFLPSWRLHQ